MSKIIIIGDTVAPYHPLPGIFPLSKLFGEESLTFTNDYGCFAKLSEFDLLICYADAWFKQLTDHQAAAFLDHIDKGGKILSIHTGISLQNTPALAAVHGAKFCGHPPYGPIQIKLKKGHPLTAGIADFRVNDEPYHFEVFADIDIFASYQFGGATIPAAWSKKHGQGEIIYLMPGHDETVFACEEYLKLVKACARHLLSSQPA